MTYAELITYAEKQFDEITSKQTPIISNVGDYWMDDHVTCAKFNFNGVIIKYYWCGNECISAVTYCDRSKRAMKEALPYFKQYLLTSIENEENPEFLALFGIKLED